MRVAAALRTALSASLLFKRQDEAGSLGPGIFGAPAFGIITEAGTPVGRNLGNQGVWGKDGGSSWLSAA